MGSVYWKLTDLEYRDLYHPDVAYYPNSTIEAGDKGSLIIYPDFADVMRSIFVDRWPYRLVQVSVEADDIVRIEANHILCRKVKVQSEESLSQVYGPNGEKIVNMISRVSKIDWFSAVGTTRDQKECEEAIRNVLADLSLGDHPIEWISLSELQGMLDYLEKNDSPLWSKIEEIRVYLKATVSSVNREDILSYATDGISELLLDRSYTDAVKRLHVADDKVHRIASGAVMYLIGTSCAWDTLGELPGGWRVNPFFSLIRIFELGHWPLGIINDKFYIL